MATFLGRAPDRIECDIGIAELRMKFGRADEYAARCVLACNRDEFVEGLEECLAIIVRTFDFGHREQDGYLIGCEYLSNPFVESLVAATEQHQPLVAG